jgi:RNA polymerase sigma-70 factor (ECF subfamily)
MRPDPAPVDRLAACSDPELASRIAGGDRGAFEILMRRHNRTLYRAARSILKDDAEAEDAVQDAWIDAWGAIGRYRGDAKLSTWLTRIAVNVALGRLRKRHRSADVVRIDGELDMDTIGDDEGSTMSAPDRPDVAATRAETRALLERAIDALPDAFRVVFVMRAVEEMSVEESAAALGIPEATVRSRFFRARGQLRESLAREIDHAVEHAFGFAGARCDRIVANVLARLDEPPRARPPKET